MIYANGLFQMEMQVRKDFSFHFIWFDFFVCVRKQDYRAWKYVWVFDVILSSTWRWLRDANCVPRDSLKVTHAKSYNLTWSRREKMTRYGGSKKQLLELFLKLQGHSIENDSKCYKFRYWRIWLDLYQNHHHHCFLFLKLVIWLDNWRCAHYSLIV